MSDPNKVSADVTEGAFIGVEDMRLLKEVAVVGSGDERKLVLGV